MDRDNIFQLATSNPEITEDQRLETSPRQSWWLLRHPGEETSCNSRSSARSWPAPSPTFQVLRWQVLCSHQHFYCDHIYIEEKELLKEHAAGPDEMFWGAEPVCARDPLLSQELHRHLVGGEHCSPCATLWSWRCHPTSASTQMTNVQHEYSKSPSSFTWSSCQVEVIPIKNEADLVVLFLCNYRDITAFKVTGNLSFLQSFWSREIISYIPHSSESLLQTYKCMWMTSIFPLQLFTTSFPPLVHCLLLLLHLVHVALEHISLLMLMLLLDFHFDIVDKQIISVLKLRTPWPRWTCSPVCQSSPRSPGLSQGEAGVCVTRVYVLLVWIIVIESI